MKKIGFLIVFFYFLSIHLPYADPREDLTIVSEDWQGGYAVLVIAQVVVIIPTKTLTLPLPPNKTSLWGRNQIFNYVKLQDW